MLNFVFILFLLNPVIALSQGVNEPVYIVVNEKAGSENNSSDKIKESANSHINIASHSVEPNAQNNSNNQSNPSAKETLPENNGWNTANTFMSIFTAMLVCFNYGLWKETKNIVKITRKSYKRQLRAYVSARLADGEKIFLDGNNCLSVPLIVENHGQTPAHKIKTSFFVNFFKYPLNETLDPPEYKGGSVVCLHPRQKNRIYPTLPRALNSAEMNAIRDKKGCFCVWGYMEYADIFNNIRITEFRMYSTGADLERGELAYCENGNNAT